MLCDKSQSVGKESFRYETDPPGGSAENFLPTAILSIQPRGRNGVGQEDDDFIFFIFVHQCHFVAWIVSKFATQIVQNTTKITLESIW